MNKHRENINAAVLNYSTSKFHYNRKLHRKLFLSIQNFVESRGLQLCMLYSYDIRSKLPVVMKLHVYEFLYQLSQIFHPNNVYELNQYFGSRLACSISQKAIPGSLFAIISIFRFANKLDMIEFLILFRQLLIFRSGVSHKARYHCG